MAVVEYVVSDPAVSIELTVGVFELLDGDPGVEPYASEPHTDIHHGEEGMMMVLELMELLVDLYMI